MKKVIHCFLLTYSFITKKSEQNKLCRFPISELENSRDTSSNKNKVGNYLQH